MNTNKIQNQGQEASQKLPIVWSDEHCNNFGQSAQEASQKLPGRVIGARHTQSQNDAPEYYSEQSQGEHSAQEASQKLPICETCGSEIWPTRMEHHKTWCNEENKAQAGHSPLPETTGLPWIVETRPDSKYPDIILAQIIAPRGYIDDIGNVSRCAVTDWLDSPADARLIVNSVNNAEKLAGALRGMMQAFAWNSDATPENELQSDVKRAKHALAAYESEAGQ